MSYNNFVRDVWSNVRLPYHVFGNIDHMLVVLGDGDDSSHQTCGCGDPTKLTALYF
jgi:hypothetical protein